MAKSHGKVTLYICSEAIYFTAANPPEPGPCSECDILPPPGAMINSLPPIHFDKQAADSLGDDCVVALWGVWR